MRTILHGSRTVKDNQEILNKQRSQLRTDILCGRVPHTCPLHCATLTLTLKADTSVTPALGNVHTSFVFSTLFYSTVRSQYGTNGWTNRQTDGQDPQCGLSGRPHNNKLNHCLCVFRNCFNVPRLCNKLASEYEREVSVLAMWNDAENSTSRASVDIASAKTTCWFRHGTLIHDFNHIVFH